MSALDYIAGALVGLGAGCLAAAGIAALAWLTTNLPWTLVVAFAGAVVWALFHLGYL